MVLALHQKTESESVGAILVISLWFDGNIEHSLV